MIIENVFELGEILFLVTDHEQRKRVVTAIIVCPDESLLYELTSGTIQSRHYSFELSREQDLVMKTDS